jgi:riboflavin kinase/FMN adenylyltransferase
MEFSRLTALEYVRDLLVNALNVKTMVVGYDHHFGRNREGDFNDLVEFGNIYGFKVEEISALMLDEVNISSTKIRKALTDGDIQTANSYLGYSYQIKGTIVAGDGIGTKLGFPTANVKVDDQLKLIPKNGVYAIEALFEGREFNGMLNIGHRPTVSNTGESRIEVHLFDFDEKIYDRKITLMLKERLRDEKRFDSKEELIEQLKRDEQAVKAIFHK